MNTERIAEIAKRAFNPPSHYAYAAGLADIDFLLAALQVRDEETTELREALGWALAFLPKHLSITPQYTKARVLFTRGNTEGETVG